eukprot:GHVP01062286.1.p1 GENE.GHVP01062286.1~~GHVP01062286.1.p1  ORF type:complete len:332 (+),score=52.85 GHVP01062286.1:393-1388(+)
MEDSFFDKHIKIGTHDGLFHADEALSCYMLKKLCKKGFTIVRSRSKDVQDTCDILVDTGSVYDHQKRKYDHHQRGFEEKFTPEHKSNLSAAGLVYRHYGKKVIKHTVNTQSLNDTTIDEIYSYIYDNFIYAFDCWDTGVEICDGDVVHGYDIFPITIFGLVGYMNPSDYNKGSFDKEFLKAVEAVGSFFDAFVKKVCTQIFPDRKILEMEFNLLEEENDQILVINKPVQYREHIEYLEKKYTKDILFIVTPGTNGNWVIRAITKRGKQFESKLPLLEDWRGKRDEELAASCGIPGAIFVHSSGFIGAAKKKKDVINLAFKTIEGFNKTKEA